MPQATQALRRVQLHCGVLLAAILLTFACGTASAQSYTDSTRIKTHTNDNGMSLGQGDVGDPGTRGFKDPAQSLNPHVSSETNGIALGTVLARSTPAGTLDGWQGVRLNNVPSSTQVQTDVAAGVTGADKGSEVWFFMAPTDRFSGDLSAAYNGRLTFTLTHAETPANSKAIKAPDVVLEAACGYSLMLYNFADKGGVLSIMLNEDAGWIDSRTKRPPGVMDFLGVLSHLSAVKIRGGYFTGAESTRVSGVTITSGKAWYPCCTIDGTVDICQKKPSSYYNPPNLQYYCEGHMYKPVRVTRVMPRFSRRTGGATITVIGENFGLAGSNPIVRINGKPCQKTFFPPSIVRNDYNSLEIATAVNTFTLMGTGDSLVQPNNPAGNALVNAYSSATDSMKQRYPEHCWNGMKDDGTDTGYNYGTATSPKYIDQGEIGIDTGGPCFPLHCSSCSVPTMLSGAVANPLTTTTSVAAAANLGAGTYEIYSGTLTAVSTTTATLDVDAATVNSWYNGMQITVETSAGTIATGIVSAYTASTRLVTFSTIGALVATTVYPYKIESLDVPTTGTASAGAANTITLQSTATPQQAPAIADYFVGFVITITGGTNAGDSKVITAYTAGRLATVASNWVTVPDATSTYMIHNPNIRGRCSSQNQIQAFGSGDCKGRARSTGGTTAACSFKFPYLKYPSLCPGDGEFSTVLKDMYTEATTGTIRAKLQRKMFRVDGMYASLGIDHKPIEGVTRIIHPNPMKGDTSTVPSTIPTKVATIEIEDAVALCGIQIEGNLGAAGAATTLSAELLASVTTAVTIATAGSDPFANAAYFGPKVAAGGAGWATAGALGTAGFGNGFILIDDEIIEVSAVASNLFTLVAGGRGAFGTPITTHAATTPIYAVNVCRGAVLNIAPASANMQLDFTFPTGTMGLGSSHVGTLLSGAANSANVGLAATASVVNNAYQGLNFLVTSTAAAGASYTISSYLGATQVATLSATSTPALSGATYCIGTLYSGCTSVAKVTTDNTIVLQPGSSSVDGFYVGLTITVVGAAGPRVITSYVASTRVATISATWGGNIALYAQYYVSTQYTGFITTGGTTSAVLSGGASTLDDFYIGMKIRITGGTAAGQETTITDYVGSTKTATLSPAITLTDTTSTYSIAKIPGSAASFTTVSARNAQCAGYNQATGKGANTRCTLWITEFASTTLPKMNVGDIVRRTSSGRAIAVSALVNSAASLEVSSVAALLGADLLFDTMRSATVSCGSDGRITVTAASLTTNLLTISGTDNLGTVTTCGPGSIVTVKADAVTSVLDAFAAPSSFNYLTTFDAAGVADMPDSDIAEFGMYRYIKMDNEIMRIVALADANDASTGSAREAYGLERLTVARGQLGTDVQAHPRGTKITLMPRMVEITAPMDATSSKVYLPSGMDIIAVNLGVLTQTATAMIATAPPGTDIQTGVTNFGGTAVAQFIKIDDEIMKVVGVTSSANTIEGNEASLTVLRAQAGTLATPHAAGAMLYVMGCMDDDETGSNCGGSCKPCAAPSKGGPTQQDQLICITPEGTSGDGPSGQGSGDLPVTVESSPGPTSSPFSVRLNSDQNALVDASTSAVSCISEQNRGFQYGAHDFVWGAHIKSRNDVEEVKIVDVAVDRNTGDTYVVGTMLGEIYIQGKHIHMSKAFGGELSVTLAASAAIAGVTTAASNTLTVTDATTAAIKDTKYATDYSGGVLVITSKGVGSRFGCYTKVASVTTDGTGVLTMASAFKNSKGTCLATAVTGETYNLYKGMASFIAKFNKNGRPVWLNKLDAVTAGHQVVITSIAVDSSSGAHYIAGHFSDGWVGSAATLATTGFNYYNVDPTTRVASTTAVAQVLAMAADTYGQTTATTTPGYAYQEGFLLKYSSAGQFISKEAIKGGKTTLHLQVSNLKVRAFHASTSDKLNTQVRSDLPAPTVKTSTSLFNVEYDFGMAGTVTLGGGSEERSSVILATSAAQYYAPAGQTLTGGTTLLTDNWYNGLTITITCGPGMGQSRVIQDYNAATRIAYVQPHWTAETLPVSDQSCYSISGKPSSYNRGQHLISGGVYVTGNVWDAAHPATFAADPQTAPTDEYVCFGQMPDSYKDANSVAGVPVCAKFTVLNEEMNFLAQYDLNLRVYWSRFIYDGDGVADEVASGLITALTVVDDLVYVAGTFGKLQWNSLLTSPINLRLQNCSFDSATVNEGPPANTAPKVVSLKKLCRVQSTALVGIGAFPLQTVNDLMTGTGTGTLAQTGATVVNTVDYTVRGTLAADYVQLPTVAAPTTTKQNMYVAAYDGSGQLVWYHFTSGSATGATKDDYEITPTAIAAVKPAIGNKPLVGHWKTLSDSESLEGRKQPPDATAAKDTSSERMDSATVRGGYIYVAGNIKTNTINNYADFGITKYPLACSKDKVVGQKYSDASSLNKMQDTACAGLLQALGTGTTDVFVVKYAAMGAPRTGTLTTYGTGTQPEVQYIRRTGMTGVSETATGITVHDLTGAAFVVGTYTASAVTVYQGSNVGENTYQASVGNDGGYTYTATRASGISTYSGDDHFGLLAANRVNSIGCPMQRFAPLDEHAEKLGLTGLPDCTLYSHAASTSTTTGYVVKFNDNGDQTLRGNKNRINIPSITGSLSLSGTCTTGGAATCSSSTSPCAGGAGGEALAHVYTKPAACSSYPGGCSCLFMDTTTFSKTSAGVSQVSTGSGLSNTWNGMRVRITKGKAAGYEGIISAYVASLAADHVYYTVPALPEVPDHTSHFQLVNDMEPQPKIHLSSCAATLDVGCAAYGVEWAKTIGLPIGQMMNTYSPYGGPADVLNGDRGVWRSATSAFVTPNHVITLNAADTGVASTSWDNFVIYLSTDLTPPFNNVVLARISSYATPTTTAEEGGLLTVTCSASVPSGSTIAPLTSASQCPTGAVFYKFVALNDAASLGVATAASTGARQSSQPVSVTMIDGDVYIGGLFKGFDEFHFGLEGVDETVGYKSVGFDTWESYIVKLQD